MNEKINIKWGIGGCLKSIPPPISRRSLIFPQRDFYRNVFTPTFKRIYKFE
nr:MAG TPA: hypothetical protein [Caudoviricetes sp.]